MFLWYITVIMTPRRSVCQEHVEGREKRHRERRGRGTDFLSLVCVGGERGEAVFPS